MYRQKTWKRVAVLFAGPGDELRHRPGAASTASRWSGACRTCTRRPPRSSAKPPVWHRKSRKGKLADCTGPGPAALAGIQRRRRRSSRSATPTVSTFDEMVAAVRKLDGTDPVRRASDENGQHRSSPPPSTSPRTQRWITEATDAADAEPTVGAIGIARRHSSARRSTTRCPRCPPRSRSPATWPSNWASRWRRSRPRSARWCTPSAAGERDPETPISVVGASIIGGDTVDHGLWVAFWFFLAQLNFVLGRGQPGAAAAVRRRPHRDRGVREDPQHDPVGARHGRRGAGELPQADARHLRRAGRWWSATCC